MSKTIKVGDKVVVTRVNGEDLDVPHIATVEEAEERGSVLRTFLIDTPILGEKVLFVDEPEEDLWTPLDEHEKASLGTYWVAGSRAVEVGDKIKVLKYNGGSMQRDAVVSAVYHSVIDARLCEGGKEITLYKEPSGLDEWHFADDDISLDATSYDEEESLQHRQTHAYYDDEALSPSYSEAVKAGMTFADYTGVNITKESLDFEPKEEEILRGITAESLNFEEAPKSDAVNHPSHYNRYSREVIESIKGLCTPEEYRGYLKGNIIKYSARYSGKDGLQDIDKLAKYTQFLKEFEIEMEGE